MQAQTARATLLLTLSMSYDYHKQAHTHKMSTIIEESLEIHKVCSYI